VAGQILAQFEHFACHPLLIFVFNFSFSIAKPMAYAEVDEKDIN
jgi:hypothetical protein